MGDRKPGLKSLTRLNALPVPRSTKVLLSNETYAWGTVVGVVREIVVNAGPRQKCTHRTVMVHLDGEEVPRRFEYTRLEEFSGLGGDE